MGSVYRAQHIGLQTKVAIKVLRSDRLHDDQAQRRFAREARATSSLRSPHAIRTFDTDRLPDGIPYIVMEYLEGESLSEALIRRGPFPTDESAKVIRQAARALATRHSRTIGVLSASNAQYGPARSIAAIEDAARHPGGAAPEFRPGMPAVYEWWLENFSLVRDITLRRYPARLLSYANVLADPEATIAAVLEWIGRGDLGAALTAVKPEHRTQDRPASTTTLAPEDARAFDDLYAAVADGTIFASNALLKQLSATNQRLLPELSQLQARALQAEIEHARAHPGPPPAPIAGLPGKLAGFG